MSVIGPHERYPKGERWPDITAAALGPGFDVIAEGLPGRTTVHDDPIEGGVRAGLDVLPAVLHSHAPIDLLVLMLGTNDLKPRFSVTAVEIARSVERLGQQALASGFVKDLILVAPVPVQEAGVLAEIFQGAEARQAGLSSQIHAAANRLDAGFVEAGMHIAVSSKDGVHWDAATHHVFGAIMADAIRARLREREQ